MKPDQSSYVVDGLMAETPEGCRLRASRCEGCGTVYFPRAATCRNPACTKPAIGETLLDGRGRLYSYTIQHYQPPALFQMDDWQPYALGLVELPEGIRVMGMLSGFDLNHIRIGEPVKLVSIPLFTDSEHGEVMTYSFAPTTTGENAL